MVTDINSEKAAREQIRTSMVLHDMLAAALDYEAAQDAAKTKEASVTDISKGPAAYGGGDDASDPDKRPVTNKKREP